MEFRVLGSLEVVDGGRRVDLGAPKERALLGELVLHANRVVSRDRLIEVVWGENPPATASETLNTYVSHVRAVLEPGRGRRQHARILLTRPPGYLLAVDDDDVDAARFERLVSEGRSARQSGDSASAATALTEALTLWRGRALADFTDEPWAQAEAARLDELRLTAIEERMEADLAMARHHELTGELRRLVAEHPLRERLWGQLMVALYRSGRQSEALRAFTELRQVLAEELGIEPSAPLRTLEEDILHQRASLEPESATQVAAETRPAGTAHNLPTPLTTFVGREAEVAGVRELCRTTRLVTLTGVGGIGKSRLALEVARGLLPDHANGVFLVELAPLADASSLHEHVLAAMRVGEDPGQSPAATLAKMLVDRQVLLVLDNCEHLAVATAALAAELLAAAPGVRILATSRELLRVPGEAAWRVPTLVIPDPETADEGLEGIESVRLFIERARTAAPQREVPASSLRVVSEISRRLEGIPLAIELAAARAAVLSYQEILTHLDDRFRLLDAGAGSSPERHRTLQGVVEWSYQALTPLERALFDRLSVFSASFTLEAVQGVCDEAPLDRPEMLALLSRLVDKSMVVVDRVGNPTRYRLLDTLRGFGAERLAARGEQRRQRDRQLGWALSFAVRVEPELDGSAQGAWLDRLDEEHDNLRHALAWAEAGDVPSLLTLAASLGRFWEVRGFLTEGRRWLAAGLAGGQAGSASARAKAHRWAGVLAQRQADYDAARRQFEDGLALSREAHDQRGIASALHSLGNVEGLQGRLDHAAALYEESLIIGRELGDARIVAASLTNLGWIAQTRSDFHEAGRFTDESLAAWRELGDERGEAQALTALAYLALLLGDHHTVRSRCGESLAIQRRLGDRYGEAWSLTYLGWAAQNEGDLTTADELHHQALTMRRELGDRYGEAWSLSHLGEAALLAGDAERAQARLDESLTRARELSDTYCITWTLLRLGKVARARHDASAAVALFRQGLAAARQHGDQIALAACMEGLAQSLASVGGLEPAARLIGTAATVRARTGAPLPRIDQQAQERTVAVLRRALGDETFDALSSVGRNEDIDEALREFAGVPVVPGAA
ncbi:MAG: BTAD domain-containing putative transcriptional regulator [Acidimicrobiales bacterium]